MQTGWNQIRKPNWYLRYAALRIYICKWADLADYSRLEYNTERIRRLFFGTKLSLKFQYSHFVASMMKREWKKVSRSLIRFLVRRVYLTNKTAPDDQGSCISSDQTRQSPYMTIMLSWVDPVWSLGRTSNRWNLPLTGDIINWTQQLWEFIITIILVTVIVIIIISDVCMQPLGCLFLV